MLDILKKKIKNFIKDEMEKSNSFIFLDKRVIELNNYNELKKIFKWNDEPNLDRPDIYDFDYIEDVNERRIRDTESIATVVKNINPSTVLEIGTANGMGTILLSANAPQARIYTINISPEDIDSGEGGKLITAKVSRKEIGIEYKKRNLKNIKQIFANTAKWQPNIGEIDFVFIDGCHDTEFVYGDTKKILPFMKKGGFILWHDFNIDLTKKHGWINDVCLGVEKLMHDELIGGRIFHIKDSWVGIYQVE